MAQPESAKKTSSEGVLGVGSGSSTAGGHTSIFHDGRRQRCRDLQLAKHKQKGLASAAMGRTRNARLLEPAGLAGSRGVADPRPAARDPGRNQRPATRDPYRSGPTGPAGHARSGPDMSGPARTFVWIGIIKLCFNCSISECLQ